MVTGASLCVSLFYSPLPLGQVHRRFSGCFHHSWIFLPFTGYISGLILDDARLHADICISERDEAGSPVGMLDMGLYSRKIVVASSFGYTGLSLPMLGRKRTRRRTGRRVCLFGLIYWDIYSDYFLRDLLRIMWWRTDVDDGIPQFDLEARTGGQWDPDGQAWATCLLDEGVQQAWPCDVG